VDARRECPVDSKRVLVADDDDGVCALLAAVLAPLCRITTVHDAASALELVAHEPYDAIISDYMLPDLDGLEFVARVRRDRECARTPILMISGHEVSERALEAGVDAFLDKPFTLAQLRAAVGELLASAARSS